jgi:hypothetical protein
MQTIKHVEPNGRERLIEALSVERTPEGHLVFGTEERISTGKVYVMNEAGKTVAVYDFGKNLHTVDPATVRDDTAERLGIKR